MKLKFNNLGVIKEAELEIGKLTVIAGKNNTGKTYLSYATWGVVGDAIRFVTVNANHFSMINQSEIIKQLNESQTVTIPLEELEDGIISRKLFSMQEHFKSIGEIFSVKRDFFSNTTMEVYPESIAVDYNLLRNQGKINSSGDIVLGYFIDKEKKELHLKLEGKPLENYENLEMYFQHIFFEILHQNTFLLTTQRDNISLFYKDIDRSRSAALKEVQQTRNYDLLDKSISRFPLPVEKNIDFARDLTTQVVKTDSFLVKEHPELLQEIEEMLGVRYEVSNDAVLVRDAQTQAYIPDYMASTSVRSLMYLHFWLKHQAQKGDLLMIDEPELSLHPENQIKLARLFVKLVNVGVKVWITTHSDYIIKELNNCLMLAGELEDKAQLMEQLGYKTDEILQHDDLRYYTAYHDPNLGGCTLRRETVGKYGVEAPSFEEALNQIVFVSDQIQDAVL